MSLLNLFGWKKAETEAGSACGTACGAGEKPEETSGTCMKHCPQKCIEKETPFVIRQEHCLHCGNCYENCPVKAVIRK